MKTNKQEKGFALYEAAMIATLGGVMVFLAMTSSARHSAENAPVSPMLAEYQVNQKARQLLELSTYQLKTEVFTGAMEIVNSHPVFDLTKPTPCIEGLGTGLTVSPNGYFTTNKHVLEEPKSDCVKHLSEVSHLPLSEFTAVKMRLTHTLTDASGHIFPVRMFHEWKNDDLAVVTLTKEPPFSKEWVPSDTLTFIPIQMRQANVNEVDNQLIGGVSSGEPIMQMGHPWGNPFVLTHGTLGNNLFESMGYSFLLCDMQVYPGNSGGAVISLLDWKVIGIVSMEQTFAGTDTQFSGIIPFWVIQKALKEIKME